MSAPAVELASTDRSLGLTPGRPDLDLVQRVGICLLGLGVVGILVAVFGQFPAGWGPFVLVLGLITIGSLIYIFRTYLREPPGIRNNRAVTASLTGRGALGWLIGVVLTGFYIVHYWFGGGEIKGGERTSGLFTGLHELVDPISIAMTGKEADKYFLYAFLYSVGVLIMGIRAILRYRHSRYQIIRTSVVIFCQLVFAFTIPYVMAAIADGRQWWPSYFWPLGYQNLFPGTVMDQIWGGGPLMPVLGRFMLAWGLIMTFIATPLLTFFFGKRWYCSWVCGCGGLANTVGDGWRHLSDKSLRAWKIERITIYSVLIFIVVTTVALWAFKWEPLGKAYAFLIGSIFAGVVGTGFYPILGTRVWCRFGCPMAAILGMQQKFFSRFRITTNGAQCISCGNCSKYCEMGIDVRWYAQRGQNIVRASCVGCGMCAAVCPRGVLSLENGPRNNRTPDELSLTLPQKSGRSS